MALILLDLALEVEAERAIFLDSNLNFTLQAFQGVPTTFNTSNNTTQAGIHGTGGPGGSDGLDGSALGNSIFLRAGSSLTFMAQNADDLLLLGEQVPFTDDTIFGSGGTNVFVKGNGTVVYNGTTNYQGIILINNANFKVNGLIEAASIFVCRNLNFSLQRGTLSGIGTLTGSVFVNSGMISPDRRSAIEPHIGHMKQEGKMRRNFLKDKMRDVIVKAARICIAPQSIHYKNHQQF